MIHISARFGAGSTSIEVTGHEGHHQEGRVCAAITAITQTAVLGLEEYARAYPDLVSIEITQEKT